MKNFLFYISVLLFTTFSFAQETEATTYYFIRHAEKVRTDNSDKNPHLTSKGKSRAKNWSIVFETINFDFIFSTNYYRTLETAMPTAQKKELKIQLYNPNELYNTDFKTKTNGKTVLVVGHSNTTPQFINTILGEEKYNEIEDDNNNNLYIVTILGENKNSVLLKIPHSN